MRPVKAKPEADFGLSKCAKFSEGLKEGLSRISNIVLQNHESSAPHLEVGNQRLIRVVELPAPRKAADKRNLEGLQLFHKDFGAEAGIKESFSDLEPLLMEAQDSRTSDIYPDLWGSQIRNLKSRLDCLISAEQYTRLSVLSIGKFFTLATYFLRICTS